MGVILHRFDFSVTYHPGTQNTKADALSRLHESSIIPPNQESIISPTVILAPIQWDIMTEIAEAQATDPPPAETPPNRTYVPRALRQRVIQWVHATLSSGHPGIAATVQLLTNRFWWSTLQADTINHIWQCPTCNVAKTLSPATCQPLTTSTHSTTTLDSHSNWLHHGLTAIRGSYHHPHSDRSLLQSMSLHTSTQAAHGPWDSREPMQLRFTFLWPLRGYSLWSRTQFTSRVWSAFCQKLNINVSLTSGYHPQSNGQVERLNQELTRFPPFILSPQSGRLESLPLMGWVCPELPLQACHRPHPFQVRAGFPTSLIPMVRGTLRITGSRFMAPA